MDDAEKELIRSRTDIVELVSAYTSLKPQAGGRYKGLCPFHQERTPSFVVDAERGRWRCFGACGIGGDVFSFLEKAENLTFRETIERLAERAGVTLSGRGDPEEAQRQKSERDRLYAANAAATAFFREAFDRAKLAQEYAARRGLVFETRQAFAIGYAPDDWDQLSRYLLRQKVHPDDAVKAGLISPSRRGDGTYTDRFRGRLMFPIVDVQERVVGFGGRLIVDKPDAPKYLNSPETPVFSKSRVLYALNRGKKAISEKRLAVVVEGYMDAVAAHQAGIPIVVATLGTALTDEHVRLLRRYAGEKGTVALSFDSDKAGVNAALKAAETIGATVSDLTLRVLSLPPGEDPDSLIASGRVADFHRAIDAALTVPEFRLQTLENLHPLDTESGKLEYLREAIEIIAALPSLLEQDRLIRKVAVQHPSYGANSLRAEELLRAEVGQATQRLGRGPVGEPGFPDQGFEGGYRPRARGQGNRPGYSGKGGGRGWTVRATPEPVPAPRIAWTATELAERALIRALCSLEWRGVLRAQLREHKPVAPDPEAQRLIDLLWSAQERGEAPDRLLDSLEDPRLAELADRVLLDQGEQPALSEKMLLDAVTILVKAVEAGRMTRPDLLSADTVGEESLREWFQQKRKSRGGPGSLSDE